MAESNTHSPARGTRNWLIAVGTYTRPMPHVHGKGRGIHLLSFDSATAALRELRVHSHSVNPSYLCHSASLGLLYGVSEQEEGASIDVYAVDDAATLRHLLNVPTWRQPLPHLPDPCGGPPLRVQLWQRRTPELPARRTGVAHLPARHHRAPWQRSAQRPPGEPPCALRPADPVRRCGLPV